MYVLKYLITSSQCQGEWKTKLPGLKLLSYRANSSNSIYLDMKRSFAHINNLTEQDGLSAFQQAPPLHANLQPSYPADRTTDRSVFYLSPGNKPLKDESADSDKNMAKTNIRKWDLILCSSYLVFLSQPTIRHIIHFVILYLLTCQHVFLLAEMESTLKIPCYLWSSPAGTRTVTWHDSALVEAINKV